jgi:hypothetical protein
MPGPTLACEIGFADAPGVALGSVVWTDVSAYVRGASTRRGRSNEYSDVEAGTATVTLNNRDRRFDPLHATGPHFGNLKPMRRLRLSATYAAVTYRLFTGYVEKWPQNWRHTDQTVELTAVDGFEPLSNDQWTIDQAATDVAPNAAADQAFGRLTAGQAQQAAQSITAAANATLHAVTVKLRTTKPPYHVPTGNVLVDILSDVGGSPGVVVRSAEVIAASAVGADYKEIRVPFGFEIASGTVYWVRVAVASGASDTAHYWCAYDSSNPYASGSLKTYDGTTWASVTGDAFLKAEISVSAELSGARVGRVLDEASWPAGDRAVDVGQSVVQAGLFSGSALSMINDVARAENGVFFMSADGKATFHNRHKRVTTLTSEATLGDAGGSEVGYVGIGGSYDVVSLHNYARVTIAGSSVLHVGEDATSQADYLRRDFERSGLLLQSEAEAEDFADWVVFRDKDPVLRFDSVQLMPDGSPSVAWPKALALELGDRITVVRRPMNVGAAISVDQNVEQIAHTITPSAWAVSLGVSPVPTASFILDHATQGVLDTSRLGF